MEVNDPFPASDFDAWAGSYDQSVLDEARFPFRGYAQALETVVQLAQAQPGMRLLDVGTGTGNLAARFLALGCQVWASDFSPAMLAEAQRKLLEVTFLLADARQGWPLGAPEQVERVVSAYVFHHFTLPEKVRLCGTLRRHLAPGGRLVIADIAFVNQAALDAVRRQAGEDWEEEFYWLADEALAALTQAGLHAAFRPVSDCAGVFCLEMP